MNKNLNDYTIIFLKFYLINTTFLGTHTDAPSHFAEDGWKVGEIPIERLIGPGVVVDISEKAKYVIKYLTLK